ncbi:hypothetical protein DMB66_43225 [Actinoplanes sp. ATCC 53533]|uniref:hypothetical protein n=1 Tax=Actinoplanes sp. ATCC 53533 TaxID=1288362 RepID=UPI000F76783D|nr:hypothetical protein [Actinoplanes sp. ATCC 53533]RSM50527.1 hypothetical protein DMB66_43225 [Actinoplanes sp. ATCC 53533]
MKDHRDYRTLHWAPDIDGPWSDAAAERYVAGRHDGVHYRIPRGVKHASLEFLLPLPGLRYLSVQGSVTDDSAVNAIESLEHLTLLTRSKVPLAVDRLHRLHDLAVDAREDLTGIRGLPGLQWLYLAGWRGADVSFLGDKPRLVWLRLDGRPGRLRLDGIEGCSDLRELEVLDYRVPSLAPLRGLAAMERLWLCGPRRMPADNNLDLDDLAGMRHLRDLRLINAGVIGSLAPLPRLSQLRDFRFNEVAIADGDLAVLFALPSWVGIVPPKGFIDDPSRYSHSVGQLRELPAPR